jgi:hypothetical protein
MIDKRALNCTLAYVVTQHFRPDGSGAKMAGEVVLLWTEEEYLKGGKARCALTTCYTGYKKHCFFGNQSRVLKLSASWPRQVGASPEGR